MGQLQQLLIPQHIHAIGSTIRAGPLRGLEEAYSKLGGNEAVDVLVFWVCISAAVTKLEAS